MQRLNAPIQQISALLTHLVLICAAAPLFFPMYAAGQDAAIKVTPLITGLSEPVDIAHANDGSGRLYIVERSGRVLIWDGDTLLNNPFLDIRQLTITDVEHGLLGLAFHPDFVDNDLFFIQYSNLAGDTVVAQYSVSDDDNIANPASRQIVLQVSQPANNHNGGQIRFGPDGYLYIALGDGGSSGDPDNNGQNLDTLLGKLLRIDVDAGAPYAIPADNPFIGQLGARPEIWAYGLRNPWRFSFDSLTGDLFIADVGQEGFEEVNFQTAMATGGANYGWRLMEGPSCFNPASGCNQGNLIQPVIAYDHTIGKSVTGGFRYRGQLFPALSGLYVYGDFITGKIFAAQRQSDETWNTSVAADTDLRISTFGEDEQGELYVAHFSATDGAIYRVESNDITAEGSDSTVAVVLGSGDSGCFYSTVKD